MSPTLTVRCHDGRDITGDTVLFEEDAIRVMGRGDTVTLPYEDVRGVIAGEPADQDCEVMEVPA